MKKSNKIVAVLLALVMIITAVPMMTASADVGGGDAKDENKHEHVYVIQSEVEGSCTEPAKTTFKCECGDVKVMETGEPAHIPATNGYKKKDDKVHTNYCTECKEVFEEAHKEYEYIVWDECIEPTCAKAGKVVYQCYLCEGKRSETIDPIVHTPSGKIVTDENKHGFVCSFCEKLIDEEHVWDEGRPDGTIKCGDKGKIIYYCQVVGCDGKKEVEVPSLCIYPEKEDIENGIEPKVNNYDKDGKLNEKEHVFECKYCGKDKPEAHEFVVTYATTTYETYSLLKMGDMAVVPVAAADDAGEDPCAGGNHAYGDWKITKEPECKKTGSKERVCSECNRVNEVEIPATGICTYKWEITKQPTETEDGEQVLKCTMCGNVKATDVLEPLNPCAKGHDWTDYKVVTKATCATAGEQTRECKRADCDATETQSIPATDKHNWSSWEIVKAATCSTSGTKTRYCTVCKEAETTAIPATGDHYGDWVVVAQPTLEDAGYEVKYCKECGDLVGERVVYYAIPTCKTEGTIKVTCKYCNYEAYETVDTVDHKIDEDAKCEYYTISQHKAYCVYCGDFVKLNHTWSDWEITLKPENGKKGEKVRVCSGCGHKDVVEIDTLTATLGDVNGDGGVTAVDARLVLQYVAGLREFTAAEQEAADMNSDGNITAVDARFILQVVAGLK